MLNHYHANSSIRFKLIQLIVTISGGALLLIGAILILLTIYQQERNIVRNVDVLSEAVATNGGAAIVFQDPVSAAEILAAFRADEDVITAVIYLENNRLFARYQSDVHQKGEVSISGARLDMGIPGILEKNSSALYSWTNNKLQVEFQRPIMINGQQHGTMLIRLSLMRIVGETLFVILLVMVMMGVILLVVYFFASRMQQIIIGPILSLSDTAGNISRNQDYSLRVEAETGDEVGRLIGTFNTMLDQIEAHQDELNQHRYHLERLIKERTAELEVQRDKALEATREKSEFLANMSHEIRTPMNGLIGVLSLLDEQALSEEQSTLLDIAVKSSGVLLHIINDILDFSKIEAGKLKLESVPFDLCQLANDVNALFSEQAKDKRLELTCSVSGNINCRLRGDPTRIRQVLTNLVSNAVKFTENGSVVVTLELLDNLAERQRIKFSVKDTGVGISESNLSVLFNPFTQADGSTTRQYGGTGLGLAISQKIIDSMGGGIGVDSVEGQGACFWFTIELEKARPHQLFPAVFGVERNLLAGLVDGDEFSGLRNKRVLLVDDDPINRSVELSMLKRMGVLADSVTNGREAVTKVTTESDYDLILMDCQMPFMDGYQATHEIRNYERVSGLKSVPIIAVTANALANDEGKCLDSGMNDYISKPMQFNDLARKLMQWLATGESLGGANSEPAAAVLSNVAIVDCQSERLWSQEQALLHTGGDEVLLCEVISLFHERYPVLMAELKSAIENQDAADLMASAHIFKSNLAYFASTDAVALISELEQAGKDNRFSGLSLVYQQLAELVSLLAGELERYRSGQSSLQ